MPHWKFIVLKKGLKYIITLAYKSLGMTVLLLAIVAGSAFWISTNGTQASSQQDTVIALEDIQKKLINTLVLPSDYKQVPPFSLVGTNGDVATQNILSSKWSMLFFGYTNCPDICPLTLSIVSSVAEELANKSVSQPQVVFVTVDPERDTADHLDGYLNHFNSDFVGITGDVERLSDWVSAMGISFKRHNEEDTSFYTVDHSATILLIDPENRIRGSFNTPLDVNTIVSDYQTIVNLISVAAPKS